jgi:hypothetical protein
VFISEGLITQAARRLETQSLLRQAGDESIEMNMVENLGSFLTTAEMPFVYWNNDVSHAGYHQTVPRNGII